MGDGFCNGLGHELGYVLGHKPCHFDVGNPSAD